jgi:hypothetical protein
MYLCIHMIMDLLFGRPTFSLLTPTSSLDRAKVRDIVKLATKWCVANFGVNNRRQKPFKVSIRKQIGGSPRYGEFNCEENTIVIYYNNCKNIREMIQTVIHEYTHYMQPVRGSYFKLLKEYGYDAHPMEIEARENETLYKDCWTIIKKHI